MIKDLTNQRFGKWTVLNRAGTANTQATWRCKCECGYVGTVRGLSLRTGGSTSCGCTRPHMYKPEFHGLYKLLLISATKRKIPVNLSFEEFIEFTKQTKCIYCGTRLIWSKRLHNSKHRSYNLDRKNPQKGYEKTNLVPCCWLCNHTKCNQFTHDEFLRLGKVIGQILQDRISSSV